MADWKYREIKRNSGTIEGRNTTQDNFSSDDRLDEAIMSRESFQNTLDARSRRPNAPPARATFRILKPGEYDVGYLSSVVDQELRDRLHSAGGPDPEEFENTSVLVIEDFGTTGLEGHYSDSNIDGEREKWNAFWFREGQGAKEDSSNGRAGQGKITFYRASQVRTVLGFTVRESDGKHLLFGRSSFVNTYSFDRSKWARDAFWGESSEEEIHPITDPEEIERFQSAFNLRRTKEPGLSLVVPFPSTLDLTEITRTVISDFYLSIARGRLEVEIDDTLITRNNVFEKAGELLTDDEIRSRKSPFSSGFREMCEKVITKLENGYTSYQLEEGWETSDKPLESHLDEELLTEVKRLIDKGEIVGFRCPMSVKPIRGRERATFLDVFIQVPEGLDKFEEAFVRRDLLIGNENVLTKLGHLPKSRVLVLIEDPPLSAFLADAEEPNHLKWNRNRPRLKEDYKEPRKTLDKVRKAPPLILGSLWENTTRIDFTSLSKFFPRPKKPQQRPGPEPRPEPPTPISKPFAFSSGEDWLKFSLREGANVDFPVPVTLELAYETLEGDAFKNYDPFDFSLSDFDVHQIDIEGGEVLSRIHNRCTVQVQSAPFACKISGFDPRCRLRARLKY